MKKFKKIIAMCMATVMAMSVMCVGASASTEIPLKNGVKLVMYDNNENVPFKTAQNSRAAVGFSFSISSLPARPGSAILRTPYTYGGVNNVIPVDSPFSNIGIAFTTNPTTLKFFSLYDVTADEYLTDGEYNMHGPIYFSDNFSLTGLTAGHKYIIRFAGSGALAGDVSTY